jgi:hypothetical protein
VTLEKRGRPCPDCQSHSHVHRITHETTDAGLLTVREHRCQNPDCGLKWFSKQLDDPSTFSRLPAIDNTTTRHP